jgi:CubicO group peptidase (beta-lactamase class C family)
MVTNLPTDERCRLLVFGCKMLEVDPVAVASSGLNENRLQEAIGLVAEWVATGVLPGASLMIARGDNLVAEGYWGWADARSKRPATRDTLWSIASITKPVTAATVMACVDRGLLSLDRPVVGSLPEFAMPGDLRPWRSEVTLRHLLTHTSGLAGFSVDNLQLRQRHAPIDDFITSFLNEEVNFPPGQWHLYSSVGYGLAAEIAGRALIAAGGAPRGTRPLQAHESFTLELLGAIGVAEAAFRPGALEQARCGWVESTGQEGFDWEIGNSRYYRSLGMPWGGLFTRARDLLTFVQAFLPSRRDASTRVLSETVLKEMVKAQVAVPEAPASVAATQRDITWDPTSVPRPSVPWGLGWEVKGGDPGAYFGESAHTTSFGHFGASGTIAWADPEEDLAVVLLTNRAWASRWAVRERRLARLADGIMAALD